MTESSLGHPLPRISVSTAKCVACKRRGSSCDRNFPCSMCSKCNRDCRYTQRSRCEECRRSHLGCDGEAPCDTCRRRKLQCSLLQQALSRISSPPRCLHEGPVHGSLSFYLQSRILKLFGNPVSYEFSTQAFSDSVGRAFSTDIPQIARHVSPLCVIKV